MARASTEALARKFLRLHAATKKLEQLRAELLERMSAEGRSAVDVAGEGAVVFVPASSRKVVDADAATARIADLARRLRELGELAHDGLPTRVVPVSASLKVAPPPAMAPQAGPNPGAST